jgi:hypothetical protein
LSVWLSTISPCWYLRFSIFFSFSSSFFSFFLGSLNFTIVT